MPTCYTLVLLHWPMSEQLPVEELTELAEGAAAYLDWVRSL